MTNIIDFPSSWYTWFEKGLEACKQNQFESGKKYFYKSLKIEFQIDALVELVELCLMLNQVEEAERVMNTYYPTLDSLREDDEVVVLYAKILQAKGFDPLDQVTLTKLLDLVEPQSRASLQLKDMLKEIKEMEKVVREVEYAIKKNELTEYFDELYEMLPFDLLKQLKSLYLSNNESVMEFLLAFIRDGEFLNYHNADILHYLIRKEMKGKVETSWFMETMDVDLGTLVPQRLHPFFIEACETLEAYCEKNNPNMTVVLMETFICYAMSFYPFYNRIAPTGKALAEEFIAFQLENKQDVSPYFMLASMELQILFGDI